SARLACALRRQLHRIRTGGRDDVGDLQALLGGVGPLVVGDRSCGALDCRRGSLVALRTFADATVEGLAGALAPRAVGRRVEILLEVVRGARLIAAEDHIDLVTRQGLARVGTRELG